MTAVQLDLIGTSPVDTERDAILALIAGDPIHARDRAVIVAAIRDSVRPDGTVTSNEWRPRLTGADQVYPRVVGAVVHQLVAAGVLVPLNRWERSTDLKGRNGGKPNPVYAWRGVTDASL